MMEGLCIVLLVEPSMRHHGAVDNGLVVSQDVALVPDQDTKVVKIQVQVNNLVHASASGNEF